MSTRSQPTIRASVRPGAAMQPAAPMPGGAALEVAGAGPVQPPAAPALAATAPQPGVALSLDLPTDDAGQPSAYTTVNTQDAASAGLGTAGPTPSAERDQAEQAEVDRGAEQTEQATATHGATNPLDQKWDQAWASTEATLRQIVSDALAPLASQVAALSHGADGLVAAAVRGLDLTKHVDAAVAAQLASLNADAICAALWPHVNAHVAEKLVGPLASLADALGKASMIVEAGELLLHPVQTTVVRPDGTTEQVPVVEFRQSRKHVQFTPVPLPGGDVALRLNYDPAQINSAEIRIPDSGSKLVGFGYGVRVPPGWQAEVTTDGIAGQRVVVALLEGDTAPGSELKLALHSNRAHTVRGGGEVARLHLRRAQPSAVRWTDINGASRDVGPAADDLPNNVVAE